jgi:ABC-type glycerol-3-phosphate transport system substrate-binding protein
MLRGKGGIYQPVNGLVSDAALKSLSQGTIVANTDADGNLWGVPLFNDTNYLVYNKEILENAGVNLATFSNSWEDFIDACAKVKASGIVPISFANKEGIVHEFWAIDMMHEYASNYFSKFSSGKVAFIWFINSMYISAIKEGQIDEAKVGYLPHVEFGNGKLSKKIAGLGYCMTISNWTKYPKQAARAIEYFVSEKWQTKMLTDYGVVPAHTGVKVPDISSLTPNMQFHYKEHDGNLTICPYEVLVGLQYDAFIRNLTPYFHNEISYADFAKELTEASTEE